MHSGQRIRLLCEQVNARNCRDRRKRLAAEPQGTDGGQVFSVRSLLVACRRKAIGASSGAMPQPLSVIRR